MLIRGAVISHGMNDGYADCKHRFDRKSGHKWLLDKYLQGEGGTENPCVGGSNPPLPIFPLYGHSMVCVSLASDALAKGKVLASVMSFCVPCGRAAEWYP
jgi:hypothetical protein